MDRVPEPFRGYVLMDGGEHPLDCWYAMSVEMDPWGRPLNRFRNAFGQDVPINPRYGLLLLTNRRLQHLHQRSDLGGQGSAEEARIFLSLPLSSIESMAILTGLTSRLIQLQVQGVVHYPGPGGQLFGQQEGSALTFEMGSGTDLEAVVEAIRSAGAASSAPPTQGGYGSAPGRPERDEGGGGGTPSWIRLHAEDEP